RTAGRDKLAPWSTPQAFSSAFLNARSVLPTFEEFNAMVYAAVSSGAKGLIPFMYAPTLATTDLRLGYDYIYESLFMLEPYLLESFPGLPVKVEAEEDAVQVLLQKHKGNFALLAVNLLPKPISAKLELPKEVAGRTFYGLRSEESVKSQNAQLNWEFAPYEVKIFTTDSKISSTLKSDARFRLELEAARKELETPGNQIFGKGRDIVWSASSIWPNEVTLRTLYTLCDGEKSALGYRAGRPGENEWIMMGFPREAVRFQKVRLYGEGIAKAKCSYLKRGEWLVAGEVEWDASAPSVEIELPEVVSTVKVRLDLIPHQKNERMELYEVEMLQ
ncbi:MAG: hypothetical protein ACK5LK_07910, partial [Chthoniobacterales bacterium]